MKDWQRIVVDTNVLIGRLLVSGSMPARAVSRAVDTGQLLVSDATMNELADALSRRRFDRYLSIEDRQQFFEYLAASRNGLPSSASRLVVTLGDDKLLEVAINGHATLIGTGDADLMALIRSREFLSSLRPPTWPPRSEFQLLEPSQSARV
jgi:putative PIN family toxin of toxin-antitoxin system